MPKAASYEFVGRFPESTKDLRGLAQVCGCGKLAVCEKAGKTVCGSCAKLLKGREYPVRTGQWRGAHPSDVRYQLDMIERRELELN